MILYLTLTKPRSDLLLIIFNRGHTKIQMTHETGDISTNMTEAATLLHIQTI